MGHPALAAAVATAALLTPAALHGAPSISLDRAEYGPSGTIVVTFEGAEGLPDDAWLGIVPSSVPHGTEETNDAHDVTYAYLSGAAEGSVELTAPDEPGEWDVRLNESDAGGRELASVTFRVRPRDLSGASLALGQTTFIPGERLEATFAAPRDLPPNAWVGVIPSSVPHGTEEVNDQHDLEYVYLEGRTSGVVALHAPAEPGAYDLRMNESDSGGAELASVSFTVSGKVAADEIGRQLEARGRVALYGIRFASGKADLDPAAHATLAEVAELLADQPELRLLVVGHTDSQGDDASNLELSRRRAAAVVDHLVRAHGVDAGRLAAEGRGESEPVGDNERDAGRALNRRVELVRLG